MNHPSKPMGRSSVLLESYIKPVPTQMSPFGAFLTSRSREPLEGKIVTLFIFTPVAANAVRIGRLCRELRARPPPTKPRNVLEGPTMSP